MRASATVEGRSNSGEDEQQSKETGWGKKHLQSIYKKCYLYLKVQVYSNAVQFGVCGIARKETLVNWERLTVVAFNE